MIGMILVTHGRLAEELRLAMEHVVGAQRGVDTVCIGPDDDVETRRSLGAGTAGSAIASLALNHNASAACASAVDRTIRASAVDDNDLVDDIAGNSGEDPTDRRFLVERRDDQRDSRPRHRHKLQRNPQPAHAGDGRSLSSAARNA